MLNKIKTPIIEGNNASVLGCFLLRTVSGSKFPSLACLTSAFIDERLTIKKDNGKTMIK